MPVERVNVMNRLELRTQLDRRRALFERDHDPVEAVMVVRNLDHEPTSPSDGTLIWSDTAIEPGAEGFHPDTTTRYDAWYAVYSTDGTHVLPWTREGFNSASVPGKGPAPGTSAAGGEVGGCGCDSSPAPASLAWFGLFGPVALRRKQPR